MNCTSLKKTPFLCPNGDILIQVCLYMECIIHNKMFVPLQLWFCQNHADAPMIVNLRFAPQMPHIQPVIWEHVHVTKMPRAVSLVISLINYSNVFCLNNIRNQHENIFHYMLSFHNCLLSSSFLALFKSVHELKHI